MRATKRILCMVLSMALAFAMPVTPASAAKKKAPKLNKKKLTLTVGKTAKLKVKNTKKKIKWSSSKKSVATVNKKGKVTAKKAGKTTITAKVGKKKLKCKVTVNPKKVKTTPTPKPTVKPNTGTPTETAVKIASASVKDNWTVEVVLSSPQALSKDNFDVKVKKYANGEYLRTLAIDNVKTKDQKTYEINIDGSKGNINLLEHVKITVTGLKVTGTATVETIYSYVEDKTDDYIYIVKTGETLANTSVECDGYAAIVSKELPEGIDATLDQETGWIEFTGTFTTTGKKQGTIVYKNELGSKYTMNLVWFVGSDENIVAEAVSSYGMAEAEAEIYATSQFYITGGSGNYTYSVVDESYQNNVTVDEQNQSLEGRFAVGTHNVEIKVTDAEDENITTTFTWTVDIKEGKMITVRLKDANGNVIEDVFDVDFENQDKSNLYCPYIGYSVNGETEICVLEGSYNVYVARGGDLLSMGKETISSNTSTVEVTLPLYVVSLSYTSDIDDISWYNSDDVYLGKGSRVYLAKGTYSLYGVREEGMKAYDFKVDVTVANANTSATVTLVNERDLVEGEITLGASQDVAAGLDYQYYSFTPEESGSYRFYSAYANDVEVDTEARLLSSDLQEMASNDDGEDMGLNFEIIQELEAGETYYIGIKMLNDSYLGESVELHVEKAEE